MANTNMPTGLKPVGFKGGAPYNGASNRYFVPATDATELFVGDPVIIAGDGDSEGVPTITRAVAGGRITGAIVGFVNADGLTNGVETALELGYRKASEATYVLVADDPDLLFEVQEDSVGGALAATNIGNNADLVIGAGNAALRTSGAQLDSSTAATASAGVRIVRLSDRQCNEIGDNAKWLVSIIETTETAAAGTTGV